MNLNDLFISKNIDPKDVIIMRHSPSEPSLRKVLPWLAAEKPEVYNAYQKQHSEKVENALSRAKYIASFIGHEPGKALFTGLYKINGYKVLTRNQFQKIPEVRELESFGMKIFGSDSIRKSCRWFDLELTDFYASWKGKLIIFWPPPELSWWRWANRNEMPVVSILEDNALNTAMPDWNYLNIAWSDLSALPISWQKKLAEWRGIYFIFDQSDGKGYVGSAYGSDNILGRWKNYMATGHGENALFKNRDPKNFQFTILQRVSPDMDRDEVIRLESSWKERLHTRYPFGLNKN